MTEAERILTNAQERIRDIENFTQHSSARDKHGDPVRVDNSRACKFCGSAALHLAQQSASSEDRYRTDELLTTASRRLYTNVVARELRSIIEVNDCGELLVAHGRVMQVFDLARDLAAGRGV